MDTAKSLLRGKTVISTDLGITENRVKQTKKGIEFLSGEFIDRDDLQKIAKRENSIYFITMEGIFQVAILGKHFYKLVPTSGAPTLEIDGIRMHKTKDTTPDLDAQNKIKTLELNQGILLDTCMGLGYTTIAAIKYGVGIAVSVELEPSVIRIAEVNPWSRDLFTGKRVHKLIGDIFTVVDAIPDEFFDYIVHDPPRHGHAGHLYGEAFYRKLYRVIRVGGRLFHYTGEPRSRYRGVNVRKGISRRLKNAGFKKVKFHRQVMGFTCSR